jgi:hypothetical protein
LDISCDNIQKSWKPLYDPNEDLSSIPTLGMIIERMKEAEKYAIENKHCSDHIMTDDEIIDIVQKPEEEEESFTGFDTTEPLSCTQVIENNSEAKNAAEFLINYMAANGFAQEDISSLVKIHSQIIDLEQNAM